jgi:hypothetical protein
MQNIFISFDCNTLKLSLSDKNGISNISKDLDASIVEGAKILDLQKFSDVLTDALGSLKTKTSEGVLNFTIAPDYVYSFFLTLGKDTGDIEAAVHMEAIKRLEVAHLDDLYFSYFKIAPFVYQFIGVKKDILDSYLEISNIAKIPVQSVVPWLFLFPKVLADNDPCIFLTRSNTKEIIALSEFNGIYYIGSYEDEQTSMEDMTKLVEDLSIYKRAQPIKRVFTLDYGEIKLDDDYKVAALPVPINGLADDDNYKLHILFNYLMSKDNSFLMTNVNLLNLLQLPAVNSTPKPMVYAGALAVVLVLAGGLYFGFANKSSGELAQENTNTAVLGNEAKPESTPSQPVEKPKPVLKKADLKIRIENGAGIAGIAAKAQTKLADLEYTVTGIGNYEGENRNNTLIRIKKSKADFKELLTADLKDTYELSFEETLPETEEHDALVVLGAK